MNERNIRMTGVVGRPVAHSLSPTLHEFWLRRAGEPDRYAPLHVEADDLERVLLTLPMAGFVGVNVTTPHKERAAALCDRLSTTAAAIGSVNTITYEDGALIGETTDGFGFLENLRASVANWSPAGRTVACLGAGGAARAVCAALVEAGATEIRIANRTADRAESIAAAAPATMRVAAWPPSADFWSGADLIVNMTTLGMDGGPTADAAFALPDRLDGVVATDLIYAPLETPFLASARRRGATIVDGLGMLLHQARPGFRRWHGFEPTVDAETRAAVLAAS